MLAVQGIGMGWTLYKYHRSFRRLLRLLKLTEYYSDRDNVLKEKHSLITEQQLYHRLREYSFEFTATSLVVRLPDKGVDLPE
jgi:hypothetical protein